MRWDLTTTQRGLGWKHQRARARLLAKHRDGTPCPRCGKPMYRTQNLDAGHSKDRALHGPHVEADRLEHRRCNRAAGAALGNQLRHVRRTAGAQVSKTKHSRQW